MPILKLEPLTSEAFAPFGDVIEINPESSHLINGGSTTRFHALGYIQVLHQQAQAAISMARAQLFTFPIKLHLLERHPWGSQAWLPTTGCHFVVVVAENNACDRPHESQMRAFYAQHGQGVNYHAGTWHHPLLAHKATDGTQYADFIVVDCEGLKDNCDEVPLSEPWQVNGTWQ